MATATLRDNTNNQFTVDYRRKVLALFNIDTVRRDYANISGAEETALAGTLMGIVAATGKYVPCQSDASDGSQVPVVILFEDLSAQAIAATSDDVLMLNGGDVDKGKILFAKTGDALTTLVASAGGDTKSMQDWLISNSKDIVLKTVVDSSEYDN